MHRGIQNPVKHLKWSRKERLAKSNGRLELFLKDITICLTGLEIPKPFKYSLVLIMPRYTNMPWSGICKGS